MHENGVHARDADSSEVMSAKTEGSVAHDIGWQALGPAIAFTILATVIVTLRWYARYGVAQCVGPDDYVVLISLVSHSGSIPMSKWSIFVDHMVRFCHGQ